MQRWVADCFIFYFYFFWRSVDSGAQLKRHWVDMALSWGGAVLSGAELSGADLIGHQKQRLLNQLPVH